VYPARRDEPKVDEGLPDPRLNPLINPRLGRNLGRWAHVYYTTPPEKREQAVLELVRELENAPTSEREIKAPGIEREQLVVAPRATMDPTDPETGAVQAHFCITCGSLLKEDKREEPQDRRCSPTLVPSMLQIEGQAVETGAHREKGQSRKHTVFVLITSVAIGAWGVWHIRSGVPPQPASKGVQVLPATTNPIKPHLDSRTNNIAPVQPERATSQVLSKPPAGKPIGCREDHLQNCHVDELRRRTVALAAGIDALFLNYDARMTQLLRAATAHTSDSTLQKQNRLRQANYSAQVWEHVQLSSYVSHLRNDALKYRAELMRRVIVPKTDRKKLNLYQDPHSCLELHYIAEDLRRLATRPLRLQTTIQASAHRALNASPSH
jgi:hypothetical protein